MSSFIAELSEATGIPHYAVPGAFQSKDGCIIGYKRGCLVEVGIVGSGLSKRVSVVFRFRSVGALTGLKAALKKNAEMKGVCKRVSFTISSEMVTWAFNWPFGLKAPKLAPAIDSAITTILTFTTPLKENTCEECSNSAEVLLLNGIPNLICENCRGNVTRQQLQKERSYKEVEPNYLAGVLYGSQAAVVYALIWGFGGAWLFQKVAGVPMKLLVLLYVVLGIVVAKLVLRGAQRVTPVSMILASVITLIGLLGADILLVTFQIVSQIHLRFWPILRSVAGSIWRLKIASGNAQLNTFFELLGAAGSAGVMWEMRPKFKIAFEKLGTPSSAAKSLSEAAR